MGITKLAAIAWRNLWRQRRRTLLTLSSIVFGFFLAVMFTSLQDRSFADMIDTAARMGTGHVALQHPEFADSPSLQKTVLDSAALIETASATPGVRRAVPRVMGHATLATARDNFGALLMAYDPAREDETTMRFGEALVEGEMLTDARDKGLVLGQRLAHNLGVTLGKKVVFTAMNKDGDVVSGMGRVKGVIKTGAPSLDATLCLVGLDTARASLGYAPGESSAIAVFVNDSRGSAEVARRLGARVGDGVAAVTWDDNRPQLSGFIAMKVGGARFMELIIGVLVTAAIFNTLFVSVMERLREFGIMLAIGFSPRQLFGMIMLESVWLALVGLTAGGLLTVGPYYYMVNKGLDMTEMLGESMTEVAGVGFDPILKVGIFPENLALIIIAVLLATLTAGLYPAWRAGTVTPVESIKLV
ncbi:MAG: ABC transporter permease [Myxococcales bacterium]|nr:ABC transporter permease [Myxococcales bacterium]